MAQSNEAPIIVDGQKVTMLINSGAKVSSVSSGLYKWMALLIHSLDRLLELEGMVDQPSNTRGMLRSIYRYQV